MQTDPVCGMQVDEKTAQAHSNYNGREVYFCSEQCKQKFESNPDQYGRKSA